MIEPVVDVLNHPDALNDAGFVIVLVV